MASSLQLHEEFCEVLGSNNVYFDPPESKRMEYPCIRYKRAKPKPIFANDELYAYTNQYEVTVIDYDPDSNLPDKLMRHFRMCTWDRAYTADNLSHFIFTIYY